MLVSICMVYYVNKLCMVEGIDIKGVDMWFINFFNVVFIVELSLIIFMV